MPSTSLSPSMRTYTGPFALMNALDGTSMRLKPAGISMLCVALVAAGGIDHVRELAATREAHCIGKGKVERHRHVVVIVIRRAVRRNIDIGSAPQRVPGRQRLG